MLDPSHNANFEPIKTLNFPFAIMFHFKKNSIPIIFFRIMVCKGLTKLSYKHHKKCC